MGAVIGGTGGMAAGFAVGSVLLPGFGSLVGAIIGGLGGSYAGEEAAFKAQEAIEEALSNNQQGNSLEKSRSHSTIRGSNVSRASIR